MNERTLRRRFARAVGHSPLAYLQMLRVEAAKRLLETTDARFDAIGQRVGHSDFGTFRALFKRSTGLSPRDYRHRFGIVEARLAGEALP